MVPQRDWLIDTMIADAVKAKGHSACVRKFLADDRTAVIHEKPDVVVIPVVRCEYTRDLATRLKSWGVKVIARRSEAGVSRTQYERLSPTWKLDHIGRYDYKDLIDLELIWSRQFADILVEEGKVREKQVRVIGGITLDPYFKWDLVSHSAKVWTQTKDEWLESKGFDPEKKTLYFVTGFVHAERPEYTLPEAPLNDPIHQELHERDKKIRSDWLEAIDCLSRFGQYNILVRPHGGEDIGVYWGLDHGVCVSTDGSAGEGLYYSDCMIHSGSTMAVEAHLLRKPAFRFGNTAQDDLIGSISPDVKDVSALYEAIAGAPFGRSNASIQSFEDLEKNFYGPIDGRAHERCAEAICEFEAQQKTIPSVWPVEELQDYTSEGVIKINPAVPVVYCRACQKGSQNLTGQSSWRCPHCSIMITKKLGVVSHGKG